VSCRVEVVDGGRRVDRESIKRHPDGRRR
jgi:hypothetical protein